MTENIFLQGGMKRDDSANDLQYELKNRLSMHGNPDSTTVSPSPRSPLTRLDSSPGVQPAMPDVDAGTHPYTFSIVVAIKKKVLTCIVANK